MAEQVPKPDYGIDAPAIVRDCLLLGLAGLVLGSLLIFFGGRIGSYVGAAVMIAAMVRGGQGALMVLYANWGKFQVRDRMLTGIAWRGDEVVLDIGTDLGLLLIGAAKKLRSGKAIGIDIWRSEDLSDNSRQNTLQNAALEGVQDRIELKSEDVQAMRFGDASFDVVLSNLGLHNIPTAAGREKACQEIARVLKPGGTALISDYRNFEEYAHAFQKAGCSTEDSARTRINFFPPLRLITVHKPTARPQ